MRYLSLVLVLCLGVGYAAATCPVQGSGAAGVAAWAEENCGSDSCTSFATTCNGEFTIELLDVNYEGTFVTFEYEVCQIAGQNGLSHWIIGLGQIDCLGEGYVLGDLVDGATLNGEPTEFVVGLDPTTQVYGIKFNTSVPASSCNTFTVTFDTSALAPGYTLGTGCALAATKAGNQDIRSFRQNQPPSPGYACILGPVCEEVEFCWEGETAWADGERYVEQGNWATYTPYVPDSTVTLYAGQTMDAGTVYFSEAVDGWVTITITLNYGWRFADVAENVKIQDYEFAPSGNPSPGQFDHKGYATESPFVIVVPENNFYGVHVDVEQQVDCP